MAMKIWIQSVNIVMGKCWIPDCKEDGRYQYVKPDWKYFCLCIQHAQGSGPDDILETDVKGNLLIDFPVLEDRCLVCFHPNSGPCFCDFSYG